MRLQLDSEGPGSYAEILKHVEDVLRENCVVRDDAMITAVSEDKEKRLARAIVKSVLARMDVKRGVDL